MLCQTVTLASEMLHISQPATTRLVADLESSLRFKLFDRVKGRLYPTVEARALYEEVQRSLAGVDRISRAADEIRDLRRGTLLIAAAPAIALSFLPHAIADYLKTRPEAHVSLAMHSSRTVVDMVIGQRCDVGFSMLSINHAGARADALSRREWSVHCRRDTGCVRSIRSGRPILPESASSPTRTASNPTCGSMRCLQPMASN